MVTWPQSNRQRLRTGRVGSKPEAQRAGLRVALRKGAPRGESPALTRLPNGPGSCRAKGRCA